MNSSVNQRMLYCLNCPHSITGKNRKWNEVLGSEGYLDFHLVFSLPRINGEHIICNHGGYLTSLDSLQKSNYVTWKCPATGIEITDVDGFFKSQRKKA